MLHPNICQNVVTGQGQQFKSFQLWSARLWSLTILFWLLFFENWKLIKQFELVQTPVKTTFRKSVDRLLRNTPSSVPEYGSFVLDISLRTIMPDDNFELTWSTRESKVNPRLKRIPRSLSLLLNYLKYMRLSKNTHIAILICARQL